MKTDEITNSQDVIDSRDVIARIDELTDKETAISDAEAALAEALEDDKERRETIQEEIDELKKTSEEDMTNEDFTKLLDLESSIEDETDAVTEAREALESAKDDFDEDERDELRLLRELAEEAEGYASDWRHGETLIRESYFEDYARQTAEDLYGKELRDSVWPFSCIDWKEAARQLQQDYSGVEFGGVTYYVR